MITLPTFNAHSEPIFKSFNLLKVQDIFEICQMEFYQNYLISLIKYHFKTTTRLNVMKQELTHDLIYQKSIHLPSYVSDIAYHHIINAPACVSDKIKTHCLNGFTRYAKKYTIKKYSSICAIENCYICRG